MATVKFTFSLRVANSVRTKLNKAIIDSVESSPEMVAEIRRICQQANRRAQNVENAGVYSPAVAALHEQGLNGFTKFSSGGSWEQKKEAYASAVAFLNQPTSSATGAKEYVQQFARRQGVDTDTAQTILQAYDEMRNSSPEMQATLERYPSSEQEILSDFSKVKREMYETKEEYAAALEAEIKKKSTVFGEGVLSEIEGGLRMK